MQNDNFQQVRIIDIDADQAGQRIDNFLRTFLKGVPKSAIYRILRKGEVRVNKKRIKPDYKIQAGDSIRVPPIRVSSQPSAVPSAKLDKIANLENCILFEDERLMVVNKPTGMAVHGGSGLSYGLIEGLRAIRPEQKFLELVHRLDRDTSGCLLVAKKRSALRHLHEQLREKRMDKRYLALVHGQWPAHRHTVKAPLLKNTLKSGERIVIVHDEGKPSITKFTVKQTFANATLVQASPVTGRTHQIRVHSQFAGHPIAGDNKYGDSQKDSALGADINRLFLHAHELHFLHPADDRQMCISAEPDDNWTHTINALSL
ncbi:23S rRNA pseudouridine(955/2504/2580) synthase RluC [Aestuariibacter salexigens]|uniref:23S rRNA pseudouridine(955/2504/2580) synthase RluC n=1 Tax=Aestuariibacter salexigens TaxID=226010 RepID=UPI00042273A8|nr:23S rRNA pseudouridine(955/2504/2580) synthase RluC [Aestuariibacter salexigens]